MKTSILAAAIQTLSLAKVTGLLFSFNFGKLHLQGQAQEVSVSNEGVAAKGDTYEVNKTIDFETIDISLLQKTVIGSFNSDVVLTVTDDRELLITHMFKTVCSNQALKALKVINDISDEEKLALDRLNRADTLINDLLPRILCIEPVQRTKLSIGEVFNFEQFGLDASMFAPATKTGISDNKYIIGNGEYKGCIKVYLLAEYKRDFDDLVDNGLLEESYGRNLVKEGDFTGTYAVLIPCKARA